MPRDFYEVLGVSKTADEKEIKASYRKLARKSHPDLHPNDPKAEARFKEVTEAYEVLSDPEKRKKYDRFGAGWNDDSVTHSSRASHIPEDEGFGSIFDAFFGGGFAGTRARHIPSQDLERQVDISLREVDTGTKRVFTYRTDDMCPQCRGAGTVQTASGSRANCPNCKGAGVISNERRVEVNIPAGIQDSKKLRVPGRGTTGSNGRAGDLYVLVKIAPDPQFRRRGDDLEVDVEIDYLVATLGGSVKVPTLTSSGTITVPEGTQSSQLFRLKGQGLTKLGSKEKGDLMARIKIKVPQTLEPKERELLKKIVAAVGAR